MSEVACSCSDRQSPSFCEAMGMKREWSSAAPSRSTNITCPGLPANFSSAVRMIRSACASSSIVLSSIITPESWNELSSREIFQRSVL